MITNPIKGRATDFDKSSLAAALLVYVCYLISAPFLFSLTFFGRSCERFAQLMARTQGKYLGRFVIACHRGIKFNRIQHIGPLPSQYILVANHLSRMDLIYLGSSYARPIYIGKYELRRSIMGLAGILHGNIFVKREDKSSRKLALEALRARAAEGCCLGIFPEGASNKVNGELMDLKLGAFIVAKEFGLPVVLSAIHDYPGSRGQREVTVEIFDLIPSEGYDSPESLAQEVRTRLLHRLEIKRLQYQAIREEEAGFFETFNQPKIIKA